MKKFLLTTFAAVPLLIAGCGGGVEMTDSTDTTDAEVLSAAFTGTGSEEATEGVEAEDPIMAEAQADMNARIMEAVSQNVAAQMDAFLAEAEASGMSLEEIAKDINKDVSVQFGWQGLSVSIDDEEVPFAGGSMLLNGDLGVRLRYLGGGKFALETSGTLDADLEGVERMGEIRGVPYALSLDGMNSMAMEGSFTVTVKRWKVRGMTADLTARIVESDVTARGAIGDRAVEGSVDFMDVTLMVENGDVLNNPKDFTVACSGEVAASINDETVGLCVLSPDCKGCE